MAKTYTLSSQQRAKAELERRRRAGTTSKRLWPEIRSARTGKTYTPHNDEQARFIDDTIDGRQYRYLLLKGGEGGGKSAAGIIKTLNRLRRGMSGIMVSPDLEHFKKSLWKTFIEWCPPGVLIERQRYRLSEGWEPTKAFTLVFHNEVGGFSELICGGAKESEIGSWEGPNVNFVHFDEARRHKTPVAIKTFDGRARIPGPKGESPQIYLTTTPRKHWLFDYFGPIIDNDPYADFKRDSYVATVLTSENAGNLDPEFVRQRAQTLTETEARILLYAEWEDDDDFEKFVNIIWWDNCRDHLPPLGRSEPMILSMDAAKGGETNIPDCFAVTGVTRHPHRIKDVAVRYCGIWLPPAGGLLDFTLVENEVRRLCREFSVIEVCYDPYQLHDMANRMRKEGVGNFKEFPQGKERTIADKQLQDLIMGRRIAHDGNPLLRQHIDNANIKQVSSEGIRLIKRSPSQKIDAAVSVSMGSARCLRFNLG